MRKAFPLLFALFWLLLLTYLHVIPGDEIPTGGFFNIPNLDKLVHLILFAVLVFLWCFYLYKKKGRMPALQSGFVFIAVGGLCYGVLLEFVQHYFIPNRSFDPFDMLADATGALIAFLTASGRYIKK